MRAQEAIDQLKAIYQIDPCNGSRWVETDDIEVAVSVACLHGRAYLNDHVITCSESGYAITRDSRGNDG